MELSGLANTKGCKRGVHQLLQGAGGGGFIRSALQHHAVTAENVRSFVMSGAAGGGGGGWVSNYQITSPILIHYTHLLLTNIQDISENAALEDQPEGTGHHKK